MSPFDELWHLGIALTALQSAKASTTVPQADLDTARDALTRRLIDAVTRITQ